MERIGGIVTGPRRHIARCSPAPRQPPWLVLTQKCNSRRGLMRPSAGGAQRLRRGCSPNASVRVYHQSSVDGVICDRHVPGHVEAGCS